MIRVVYSPQHLGFLVYKFHRNDGGSMTFYTHENTAVTIKEGEATEKPYWIRLEDTEEIDDIIRGLVKQGYEPNLRNDDSYTAGKMEAMTEHLADMRRLVMDGLPGEK